MDPDEFRRLGYRAVDMAAEYLAGLPSGPVFTPMTPAQREALLTQPLPEYGAGADSILTSIRDMILSHPMGNGHPRFFGWVNSPPARLAVITELLAAALNPSCAGGDHAAVYLERCAVGWLMDLVGYPSPGSMGILTSGGSTASLTCLAAARHHAARQAGWNVRAEGLQTQPQRLLLYVSSEGHSCLRKAAELMGLGGCGVRVVPAGDDYRFDLRLLRENLDRDRDAGHLPFCVVGSAGTVNSGAIDPLDDLADLCEERNLWFHVDGAYGAVGKLDPSLSDRYRGLERAQSLALDPHKWLQVPLECGCALVRDGALLRETFSLVPSYLRTEEGKGFGGLPWFSEYGFQQSRGFRALKLWVTLQQAGRSGIRSMVCNHNRLARRLAARIDAHPRLERLAPVELSVVCFRYLPDGPPLTQDALNALNQRILEAVQAEGAVFLSSTVLRDRFTLRACVLHHSTGEDDIEAVADTVVGTAARLR